jgi:hypothetical protein
LIIKCDYIIKEFEGNILKPGKYNFPFQFVLPLDLPGTFSIFKEEDDWDEFDIGYSGRIYYYL